MIESLINISLKIYYYKGSFFLTIKFVILSRNKKNTMAQKLQQSNFIGLSSTGIFIDLFERTINYKNSSITP